MRIQFGIVAVMVALMGTAMVILPVNTALAQNQVYNPQGGEKKGFLGGLLNRDGQNQNRNLTTSGRVGQKSTTPAARTMTQAEYDAWFKNNLDQGAAQRKAQAATQKAQWDQIAANNAATMRQRTEQHRAQVAQQMAGASGAVAPARGNAVVPATTGRSPILAPPVSTTAPSKVFTGAKPQDPNKPVRLFNMRDRNKTE